jgi:FtsZ-binding cell division protein ZapB
MTETEKCPFIGVDCEYILLARKAEIAQIESDLDNCDGPALQKAKIEIDRLDEDNRRLRFERDEARKENEQLRNDNNRLAWLAIDNAKDTGRALMYRKILQQIAEEGSGHGQALAYAALKEKE